MVHQPNFTVPFGVCRVPIYVNAVRLGTLVYLQGTFDHYNTSPSPPFAPFSRIAKFPLNFVRWKKKKHKNCPGELQSPQRELRVRPCTCYFTHLTVYLGYLRRVYILYWKLRAHCEQNRGETGTYTSSYLSSQIHLKTLQQPISAGN